VRYFAALMLFPMRLSFSCLLYLLLAWPALGAYGQAPPTGRFSRAVVEVGQPLDYELRYRHAPGEEVVFPDSLADFGTFEYAGRSWRPTRTRQGISLDVAVYHLRTFSLDSVQRLQLPVLVLRGPRDTLRVQPAPATVRLHRTAPVAAAGGGQLLALRSAYEVLPVAPAFNYPFWQAGLAAGLVLAGGVWAAAGRRWQQRYARYKRRKNHVYFLAQLTRYSERFALSRSAAVVERAVVLWKNYLSNLENSNLASLTTSELVAYFHNDDDVRRALRTTDRIVYGNLLTEDAQEVEVALQRLRSFAERQFELLGTT